MAVSSDRIAEFVPAGQMTEAQYDAERQRIRATYGDTATERTGSFDQELARLVYRCGWPQERVGKKEGKGQKWAGRHIVFGQFLGFRPAGLIPKSCTEWRFRGFWDRTDPNEKNLRIRFAQVAQLMEEELSFSKPRGPKNEIAQVILNDYADGKWHRLVTIVAGVRAQVVDATDDDVYAVLQQMVTRHTWHTAAERRRGGGSSWSYRIVRGVGRKVDVDVLVTELGPIVQALKVEGRKHIAEASPAAIASLAKQLEVILERLTHEDARLFSRAASKEKSDETV